MIRPSAYSLSIRFLFSVFALHEETGSPGHNLQKALDVAKGVLSEDDYLLSEILFSRYTAEQVKKINANLII